MGRIMTYIEGKTHTTGVLKWVVQWIREHPEGGEGCTRCLVQITHRLHVVHQEAVIQKHSVLMVDAFAARDCDGG